MPTATQASTKPESVGAVVQAVVIAQDAAGDRVLSLVVAWSVGVAPPVGVPIPPRAIDVDDVDIPAVIAHSIQIWSVTLARLAWIRTADPLCSVEA